MITLENEKDQLESDRNQYAINNTDSKKVRANTMEYYNTKINDVNLFIKNGHK